MSGVLEGFHGGSVGVECCDNSTPNAGNVCRDSFAHVSREVPRGVIVLVFAHAGVYDENVTGVRVLNCPQGRGVMGEGVEIAVPCAYRGEDIIEGDFWVATIRPVDVEVVVVRAFGGGDNIDGEGRVLAKVLPVKSSALQPDNTVACLVVLAGAGNVFFRGLGGVLHLDSQRGGYAPRGRSTRCPR